MGNMWPSGNALVSGDRGPGSTPGRATLELDTGYRPFGVFEMCSIASKQ